MADGGRVNLAYIEEVTWGTTPASALTKVAFATGETLSGETSTTVSNAIRGDYIRPQVVRTQTQGGGGLSFEVAYADGPLHDFIEGVFRSDWAAAASTAATTLSANDAANKFTRAAGSFVTDGWAVGMAGESSGFSTASNNGVFVVTAVDATNLTVTGIDIATETGGGDEALVNAGYLKHGTTLKSYTLERHFTDLTNTYIPHKGMRAASLSLSAQAGSILTGSLDFSGKMPSAIASATAGSGAYSASSGASNEIMNGIDHVTGIYVSNDDTNATTAVTYTVSEISLNFGSPNRPIFGLGAVGPAAIGGNSFEVTGTMRVYADDSSSALWTDYVNYTEKALVFRFQDTAGNAYVFYLPQVQITASDGPNSGGPDSDVMLNLSFTAEYDSTSSALATVTKIAA